MTDPDHRIQATSDGSSVAHSYEPPKLTVIGPLEKITLGSTGTKGDGKGSMKSK